MHKQPNRGFSKHSDTKSGFLFTEIIFQTLVIDANCMLGLEQLHCLRFTFWNPSVGFFAQELVSERNSVQSSSKQSVLRWNIRANQDRSIFLFLYSSCVHVKFKWLIASLGGFARHLNRAESSMNLNRRKNCAVCWKIAAYFQGELVSKWI